MHIRKKILLRADASNKIGIGHVMRSFALAQAWKDMGIQVIFLCFEIPDQLEQLLKKENIKLIKFINKPIGSTEDARLTGNLAHKLGIQWVIADGYDFKGDYQKFIKEQGLKLLIVDDYGHSDFYCANIILNTGLDIYKRLYVNRAPDTQMLFGPTFISLRREFLEKDKWKKTIAKQGTKLLVTMGGADPEEATLKVIEALIKSSNRFEVKVVIGPADASINKLKATAGDSSVSILQNVEGMADLMAWADIGISAGGGTLAEMAYMGLPNIILKTAENQIGSNLYEKKSGTSWYLGSATEVSKEQIRHCIESLSVDFSKRQEMSRKGQELIDGKGSQRILEFIL